MLRTSCCIVLFAGVAFGQAPAPKAGPERWEKNVAAFEEADKKTPPTPDEVLFIGSSSIVKWKVKEAFPQWKTTNHGFGGSYLSDVAHFTDRLLAGHTPRAIVLYAGDNDLGAGATSEAVRDSYRLFSKKLRAKLPTVPLVVVAVKPSPKRANVAEKAKVANEYLKAEVALDKHAKFLDVWPFMVGSDGKPREELFVADKLHMSPEGYAIWNQALVPLIDAK